MLKPFHRKPSNQKTWSLAKSSKTTPAAMSRLATGAPIISLYFEFFQDITNLNCLTDKSRFVELQRLQAKTKLSKLSLPPLAIATTWSTVDGLPAPQYQQLLGDESFSFALCVLFMPIYNYLVVLISALTLLGAHFLCLNNLA